IGPTPMPTCAGFKAAPSDWDIRSENSTCSALKPAVFRLARLLPDTSIAFVSAVSAESAAENPGNIDGLLTILSFQPPMSYQLWRSGRSPASAPYRAF